jgi:hypothetical protein
MLTNLIYFYINLVSKHRVGLPIWAKLTNVFSIILQVQFSFPPDVYLSSPVIVAQEREKRSAFPGRAMMFHGYFGNGGHPYRYPVTSHDGRSHDPQGAMSAFAEGDSISAGSAYYGGRRAADCRNCNGAKKPANVNGNKRRENGYANENGNRRPTNGNGFQQHEVPRDSPAANNPINGNGEEQIPAGGHEVSYPDDKGSGYLEDQPAAEESPKREPVPPVAPNLPATPEDPKKGTIKLFET